MPCAEAVREPRMRCSRENIVEAAKLIQLLQPRVNRVVDVLPDVAGKAYELVVDGVFDAALGDPIELWHIIRLRVRSLREKTFWRVLPFSGREELRAPVSVGLRP